MTDRLRSYVTPYQGDQIDIPNLSTTANLNTLYIDDTFPYIGSFIGYITAQNSSLTTADTLPCGVYLNNTTIDAYPATATSEIIITSAHSFPIILLIASNAGSGGNSPENCYPSGGGAPGYLHQLILTEGTATSFPYSILIEFLFYNTTDTYNIVNFYYKNTGNLIKKYTFPENEKITYSNGSDGTNENTGVGGVQQTELTSNVSSYYTITDSYLTTSMIDGILCGYAGGSYGNQNTGMSNGYALNILGLYSNSAMYNDTLYVCSGGAAGGNNYLGGPGGQTPGGGNGSTDEHTSGYNGTFYAAGGGGSGSNGKSTVSGTGGLGTCGFALILMSKTDE